MFVALLHEDDGRNTVCVTRREEEGGREVQRWRESVCFNAGVPFRHAFNSSAGISAIFNWKCHRMSNWKMSLGKDWRVT